MDSHLLDHLDHLDQRHPDASVLDHTLAKFAAAKEPTAAHFKEGVRHFSDLVNMLPEARAQVYGSRFSGLYIPNDLAHVWNEQCLPYQQVVAHSLDTLKPKEWQIIAKDQCTALEYFGPTPAAALNSLLKGPAVIDCGMFCQLGIWFGIRFILGDDAFNERYRNQSFLITRFIYQGTKEGKAHLGNPLFDFFTSERLADSVGIEHVFNVQKYSLKHPGGAYGGQNCLVIDAGYCIFNPLSSQKYLTRGEVVTQLLEAYNAPPDIHDADTCAILKRNPSFFQSEYGSIYAFPESNFFWVDVLRKNHSFLAHLTNVMFVAPECREHMCTIFGAEQGDPKLCFLVSFANPQANREKYETFYALACVKKVFEEELQSYPAVLDQYYQGILEIFEEFRQDLVDNSVSLQDYETDRQRCVSLIPSYLSFDLQAFLTSLKKNKMLPLSEAEIPASQNIKRSSVPHASHTPLTFFGVSSDGEPRNSGVIPSAATQKT